jgi:signal transduction histidine kinase
MSARVAHASCVRVIVRGCNAPQVRVTVADDGGGFDPNRLRDGGSGLAGMRERAMLAGGRLDVRTVPGGGTTIELVVDATRGRSL